MRNPVACVACRSAKQKCIHVDGAPPCDRCKTTQRQCEFPPPGTSSIHRRPKRPRQDDHSGPTPPSFTANTPVHPEGAVQSPAGSAAAVRLEDVDPYDLLTDDVKNSYLRCSYKWSFHHTPTLLLGIRDRTLEPWMAWAILALAIRFVKEPPANFRSVQQASNAFAAHARQLLQHDLETPSISRVQALLMLTGHFWGAGQGQRAWIYLGMAIRLVEIMDLCREPKLPINRRPTKAEFIDAEVRRRTAWTCFLMDSLLSGGKGRKRSLTASDMAIQLPCEKEDFVFGVPVATERLNGERSTITYAQPIGELGIIAHSMRVANIWGKVARWACSDIVNSELPWAPTSQFQSLIHELGEWKTNLPERLQYDLSSLHSHNAIDQGQAYCYMHSIYFMSHMFLHRAYLPIMGPGHGSDETPTSYNEMADMWKSWQKTSRRALVRESTTVLEMLDEMRSFGVYFLRGLVPWIGFTIYTAVGVMLYSSNFPSAEDDPSIAERAKERVVRGCKFLKDMQSQWPMAETWSETIKRMQAFYRSVAGQGSPVSLEERQRLRRGMLDYGALQPSPVQKHADSRPYDGTAATTSVPGPSLMSPPASTPIGHSQTPTTWSPPNLMNSESEEAFAFDFDISNADIEAIMMSATQDFWASFPGEVGVSPY